MDACVKPSANAFELSSDGDRYFDGLADKFSRSLYNAPRGELRLALLDALLPDMLTALHTDAPQLPAESNTVLDVGGGLGQQALWFAQRGFQVTLTEPSRDMLAHAEKALQAEPELAERVRCYPLALQHLPDTLSGPWRLIVCHAVLEWLGNPRQALGQLSQLLAPGGELSLMVFNRDALRFSNVVKGNLQKAQQDRLEGFGLGQRLTPISPLTHAQIEAWSQENGLEIRQVAGIRIFQDYLRQPPQDAAEQERLVALEKQFCRTEPHWRLARYLLYTLVKAT
ncbi:methyltransferase domain-containing protein [Halomonas sp. TBZ9]|uniref:tRNA 5-carboxymethoxyuridine methyltransferase n=1 Tax=Vreelandella azerica TaxID=2732867 RepID=A0A7Y3XA15_9GAMM|nr:methyltransferase domain-containing protein [Halomonas azerica]